MTFKAPKQHFFRYLEKVVQLPDTPNIPKRDRGKLLLIHSGCRQLVTHPNADMEIQTCAVCGCTDLDCSQCIEAQGHPCHWATPNLCSRCAPNPPNFPIS